MKCMVPHHLDTQTVKTMLPFMSLMCLVFTLCLSPSIAMAVEVPFIPKQILVYGGNGFIGSSTVERLIKAGHKLTLVNRGNWYWDSGFTVLPFSDHIKCDRFQEIEKCTELIDFISKSEQIDAVIDFSAYYPQSITDALNLLNGKPKLYIYISTDSVYEVCLKNHTEATRETDAVRPFSQEKQKEFSTRESYGHQKLECEEVLDSHRREKNGPPYISLRLPDVIGPRDNTNRWWIYQLWMRLRPYLDKDVVVVPESTLSTPMSLVYVNDVADMIFQLIEKPQPEALDQAFNLALKETPTLMEMLEDIKKELNITDLKITPDPRPDTIRLFPSVHLGPVNISKAEKILNWQPTPWKTVLKETVEFYEKAISAVYFDRARKDMIRTMQTYFTSKPYNVIRGLRKVYGLGFPEQRDEL